MLDADYTNLVTHVVLSILTSVEYCVFCLETLGDVAVSFCLSGTFHGLKTVV